MDEINNKQDQTQQAPLKETVISSATNIFSRIQAAITAFIDTQNQKRLQKIHAETTRPQWGDENIFKQGANAKATNIAPKKPEVKKEPILK